jgi:hypothetical protein
MKEAFGGTFILKLVMVFFVIYVTFIGVALQIAKLYRVKNGIINILEQNQYTMDGSMEDDVFTKIDNYLAGIPYNVPDIEGLSEKCQKSGTKAKYHSSEDGKFGGFCIVEDPNGSSVMGEHYYKVTVYFVAEFPFLGANVPLTISGETMTISEK